MSRRPEPSLVFVVGCPRSGTTWLQLLLAQHDVVATGQETHLFSNYLSSMFDRWRHDEGRAKGKSVGLVSVFDREEFLVAVRNFSRSVFSKIHERSPGTTILVEKTPHHVFDAETILDVFPDAYFVHLVRDVRAVAASLIAAGRSWARSWAPTSPVECGRYWRRAVEAGRSIRAMTERYLEVKYENLKERPVAELQHVLRSLGLDVDQSLCEVAVENCRPENLRAQAGQQYGIDVGAVVRRGDASGWRSELSESAVSAVEYGAWDMMAEFGYAPEVCLSGARPIRVGLHDALERVRTALDGRLDRLLARI